jgi:hypothetical protein
MKFDSIALLDQLIRESLFVSLRTGLVNEQAAKSAIIIDPGTLAQQERRKNTYPGSIKSFKVKAKSSSEAAIINNIKSNPDFGDASKYANGNFIYMLGAPIRESSSGNTKTYLVLIYPKTHEQFSYMPDSAEYIEIANAVDILNNQLNPDMDTVRTPRLPDYIGTSSILTSSYINHRQEDVTKLEAELANLQKQSEITNQQQIEISKLKNQLNSVQDQLADNQNQVVTQSEDDDWVYTNKITTIATLKASLEGAKAIVSTELGNSIWTNKETGKIYLYVNDIDGNDVDYEITLEDGVYMIDTTSGKIKLADY